ncbi:5274_t:CDS:1 [Ambispora leptoticha]|uniref:5274_t:CDS:1 n=1 Tax=Ambispora leptoticha TaxID=144679 RepID=A0A9N9A0D5_9GLOM|nr:5274_t:CDS:1 [Ambispora leptoticha]
MNADKKNSMKKKNKSKIKIKKGMLPKDLDLALDQLKIWTRGDGTKDTFEKVFTLAELKALIQAFQTESIELKGRKKSVFVDLLFTHLQNSSKFNEETRKKGKLFI